MYTYYSLNKQFVEGGQNLKKKNGLFDEFR